MCFPVWVYLKGSSYTATEKVGTAVTLSRSPRCRPSILPASGAQFPQPRIPNPKIPNPKNPNQSSETKDPKQRSHIKDPKPKIAHPRLQTSLKPTIPKQSFPTKDHKPKISNQKSQTKAFKLKPQTKDSKPLSPSTRDPKAKISNQ